MRPLTSDMLEYAAQDTRYLLQLKDHLKTELGRRGRLHWAQEEFARLEGTRWEAEESMEGFLRLKGARDLSRRELAVLREVANWRDVVAAELDRATFRVMGNEALFELARRTPRMCPSSPRSRGCPKDESTRAWRHLSRQCSAASKCLKQSSDFRRVSAGTRIVTSNSCAAQGVREQRRPGWRSIRGVLCSRGPSGERRAHGAKTIEELARSRSAARADRGDGDGFIAAL